MRTGQENADRQATDTPGRVRLPADGAARLRRHRGLRRRVRHLQHVLDHGRAADARARAAAHARRVAPAGARVGRPRGAARRRRRRAARPAGGLLVAPGIVALFEAIGVELPDDDTVITTRTVVVSLLVGIGVTRRRQHRAGAARDARAADGGDARGRRAAAALGPGADDRRRACSALLGLVALVAGLFGGRRASRSLGLGAARDLPRRRAAQPAARAAARARSSARRCRRSSASPGRLARENAMRNPGRTAVTAAALMIGLALVTFVSIFAAGFRGSIDEVVDRTFAGDLTVATRTASPRSPSRPRPRVRERAGRRVGHRRALRRPRRSRAAPARAPSSASTRRRDERCYKAEWKEGSNATFASSATTTWSSTRTAAWARTARSATSSCSRRRPASR